MAFDLEPDVSCTHTLMPPDLVASVKCTGVPGVERCTLPRVSRGKVSMGVLCERCRCRLETPPTTCSYMYTHCTRSCSSSAVTIFLNSFMTCTTHSFLSSSLLLVSLSHVLHVIVMYIRKYGSTFYIGIAMVVLPYIVYL